MSIYEEFRSFSCEAGRNIETKLVDMGEDGGLIQGLIYVSRVGGEITGGKASTRGVHFEETTNPKEDPAVSNAWHELRRSLNPCIGKGAGACIVNRRAPCGLIKP